MPTTIGFKKIKPGKLDTIRDWFEKLNTVYKKEAAHSLEAEHVLREQTFFVELGGEWYVGWVIDAEGDILPADPDQWVSQEHKKIKMECLEPGLIPALPGYDVTRE